jgi:hypothetical protein
MRARTADADPGAIRAEPTARLLRLVRLALVSVTAFALSVGAHVVGGGAVPGGLGLVAVVTLTVVVASLVARGRLRTWVLLPVLGALQLATHAALGVLAAASAAAPPAGRGTMPGMVGMHAGPATGAVGQALPTVHTLNATTGMPGMHMNGTAMLVAHVAATLATVLVLAAGDRAAVRMLRWWTAVLPAVLALVAGVVGASAPRPAAVRHAVDVRQSMRFLDARPRRGPPAALQPA